MPKAKTEEEKKEKAVPIIILCLGGLAGYLLWRRSQQPPTPEPGKAVLYGKVTDAVTQSGIKNIQVTCNGYSGTTDSNGNYSITNIEPGTYTVTFTDPSGYYQPATV